MVYLWNLFQDLATGRPVTQVGYMPVPPSEITAWLSLTGQTLSVGELSVIRRLDALFIKVMAED